MAVAEPDAATSVVVMLVEGGDVARNAEVEAAVKGHLSDLGVVLIAEEVQALHPELPRQIAVAREVSARHEALAVVWCDLDAGEDVFLYLADASQNRVMVRRLDPAREEDRYESMAIIIRSAVEALLEGGRIGVAVKSPPVSEPEQKPEPAPDPAPDVVEAIRVRPGLAVGYALDGHSSRQPLIHGLDLGFKLLFARGFSLFIGFTLFGPVEVDTVDAAFDVMKYPISLGAGYLASFARFRLGGGLVVTAALVDQKTRDAGATTREAVDNFDVMGSVAPELVMGVAITDQLSFDVSLGLGVRLNNVRYLADYGGDTTVIDEPWWIGPRVRAGLAVIFD